jgi:hypothetical protein
VVRRGRADIDQPVERNPRERPSGGLLLSLEQIAPNQASVGLADFDEWLPGAVVRDADDIETLIRDAVAKDGNVNHDASLAYEVFERAVGLAGHQGQEGQDEGTTRGRSRRASPDQ